jgi:hypothetical protein
MVEITSFLIGTVSFLVGILFLLTELFVVTKPVELGQGLPVDVSSYKVLLQAKSQMEITLHDYEPRLAVLENIAHWCESNHANPDASTMKVQQQQLASSQQQLDRTRREYLQLQNRCQTLEDGKDDIRKTDVEALRNKIDSQESEILALQIKIKALEARPETEDLKAEKKRAQGLQQKLDTQLQEATAADIKAGLEREELAKLQTSNKSLLAESKAAEMRAQLVASGHKKAIDKMKRNIEEVEAMALDLQYQLGQAREEANATNAVDAANASIEKLQQELKATRAQHREQFGQEVNAMKSQFQGQYEEQIRAAQEGLANAAEAETSARVKERVASEILAARKELAEAAEAELNARILAARKELAEAAEAEIESRVNERLQSAVIDALALRDLAEATMGDIPDDDVEFSKEFNDVAAECQQREYARQREAAAPTVSFDSAPVLFAAGSSPVDSSNPAARKRATGRRIQKIPGLGAEHHPQHVVARAEAQTAAAAMAAFQAGKFFGEVHHDINKPFNGERQRVESASDDDADDDLFEKVYEMESKF